MELTFRPMAITEHAYCFAQSHQISTQAGLIGHLRADFGSMGTGFFSTFFDFRESLKSDAFKVEFDDVINTLREDPQYGGILKSRGVMNAYCHKHPESCVEADRQYADDFKIFCKKRSDAVKLFEATKQWLLDRLGLEISPEKSKIVNLKRHYSEFLGFKLKVRMKGKKPDGQPKRNSHMARS